MNQLLQTQEQPPVIKYNVFEDSQINDAVTEVNKAKFWNKTAKVAGSQRVINFFKDPKERSLDR